MPPRFTLSRGWINSLSLQCCSDVSVSLNFYKKVLEKYYPPLERVNFELNTYSGLRGRMVCLLNSCTCGIFVFVTFLHKVNKIKQPYSKALRI